MNLLVDVGNTRIKWTTASKKAIGEVHTEEHKGKRFGKQFAPWAELERPERIVVSNVAGDRMANYVSKWCAELWGLAPLFAAPEKRKFKVKIAYSDPSKFGVDRWAALIGARELTKSACCVVDCGTAVTCDVINSKGSHLGGFILPGPLLTQEMLMKATHVEPKLMEVPPESLLGTDTATCISGGAYYSIVATVDRVVEDLRQELGLGIKLVMTGGGAEKIRRLAQNNWTIHPNLVLDGLRVIAQGV